MRCQDQVYAVSSALLLLLLLAGPSTPSPGPGLGKQPNFDPGCTFPEKWEGHWFQSGVRQPIQIHLGRFSTKGRCLASDGDKFLIVEEKTNCHRCVVIHEKHDNVLQYKETYCSSVGSLYSLCSHITGDALLYSMFRVNAVPLSCPFPGYHTFSYDRGHGECSSPPSTMESCTQESRLILKYQACPDVYGSESAVEEMQCLATWKEGSSRYLVGKIDHSHVSSNEDRYRCFVYEKVSGGGGGGGGGGTDSEVVYRVAQSGDATCNGLFSPMEGSRTMTLRKGGQPPRCKFPGWMTTASHWHSLDYKATYSLHHRNQSLRVTRPLTGGGGGGSEGGGGSGGGGEDSRLHCSEVKQVSSESVTIVVHYTVNCDSGFMCMVFYRRDQHVIELQEGTRTRRADEACSQSNFDRTKAPFITLVTSNPDQHKCPQVGRFSVTGMEFRERERRSDRTHLDGGGTLLREEHLIREGRSSSGGSGDSALTSGDSSSELSAGLLRGEGCALVFRTVAVGCGEDQTMEFRSHCESPATDVVSVYNCHAGWTENGTHFLITTPNARSSAGAKRYCFIYTPGTGGTFHFSTSPLTCSRSLRPGVTGALAFNITHQGLCAETINSALQTHPYTSLFFFLILLNIQKIFHR